jgi:outer membrane protein assembly factor BamB
VELTTLAAALVWSFKAGAAADAPPLVAAERVFYAAADKKLYALAAADGKELWSRRFKAPLPAPPVPGDGVVYQYVPYPEGRVYALRQSDGEVLWREQAGPGVVSAAAGGGLVAVGRGSDAVFYDGLSGEERGRFSFEDDVVGAAYVGEESFVVWTGAGRLALCRRGGGKPSWEVSVARAGVNATAAAGRVYVGAASGTAACYEATSGEELWRRELDGPLAAPPPALTGEAVLVAGRRAIYALSAGAGELRWKAEPGGNVVGAAPYGGGAVAACEDGRVVYVGPEGGAPAPLLKLDDYAAYYPLVVEGRLYITDGKKFLRCYKIG